MGIDCLTQSRAQGLIREFENLSMKKAKKLSEFTNKFLRIVFELRQLSEKMNDKEAIRKQLWLMPPRYDSLTLSLEQFGDLNVMTLVEAIGSLKVHEMRLSERDASEEEKSLLTRAMNKFKKMKQEDSQSSYRRGREEVEAKEEGETKAEESLNQVMSKTKRNKEKLLTNLR